MDENAGRGVRGADRVRRPVGSTSVGDEFGVHSQGLREQLAALRDIAATDAPVFIQGETGTGKELVARALHRNSRRQGRPLIVQNCAALSDNLLQSLLFGHRRGAFTGADRDHAGIFEAAHGGTLFLDEVGDMSPTVQASVLRAIDQGEITRLGETASRIVDVRVLSATHRDLRHDMGRGHFRDDLYYRLCTFHITLPPLRMRDGDVILLARHFLERHNRNSEKTVAGFAAEALRVLERYPWPGNVRQLASEIERAYVYTPHGEPIQVSALSESVRFDRRDSDRPSGTRAAIGRTLPDVMLETERELLRDALRRTAGNKARAAGLLGISRQRLGYRLARLGIEGPSDEREDLREGA